jgi:hypothetical protein
MKNAVKFIGIIAVLAVIVFSAAGCNNVFFCTECWGTGDCKVCHGQGYRRSGSDYVPCETCNYTGDCPKCGGDGRTSWNW